ncbi:unnamed protein product [Caenorhabditis angaria]|uniref:CDC20/Fizzy WD40 domain-containing protein n=1 Tax=Caenorhabditis angaria TaxID=860376 RepID=A0A9P1I9H7_9PELO|nr:unnamed protein product [Caenorhabditis angaria]
MNITKGRTPAKSNGLSMRKRDMTPTRNANILHNPSMVGDRFMGVRLNRDEMEFAGHLLTSQILQDSHLHNRQMQQQNENPLLLNNSTETEPAEEREAREAREAQEEREAEEENKEGKKITNLIRGGVAGMSDADEGDRILCYKKNLAPPPAIGYVNQAKVLYSTNSVINPSSSVKKALRHVPTTACKVLDAPGLTKDMYTRHMDWGSHNWVAVALSNELYLWNTETNTIKNFFEDAPPSNEGMITGVRWSEEGKYVSVGYESGAVRIYDPNRPRTTQYVRELRTLRVGGAQRCASIAWRKNGIMTCGYKSGDLVNHDVRVSQHVVSVWAGENGHRRDVTGIEWSNDENMCATSSSDRTAKIWDVRNVRPTTPNAEIAPMHTIDEHLGQVRTVQFCNFRDGVLATAGGVGDGSVKLWDVKRNCLKIREMPVCENGGVSGVVFNRAYNEMLVASDDGCLRIFRFNATYKMTHEIQASSEPIMDLVASPVDEVLIGDMEETLKVFKFFAFDKSTNILEKSQPRNVGLNVR